MTLTRLPSLSSLRAFEAVARHGSIKEAALELSVTPGAVSQQIKTLEADLGVQLFDRLPRAVVLTEAGHLLKPGISESFAGIRQAVARIRPPKRKLLRINTAGSVVMLWLMPCIHRFSDQHPELDTLLEAEITFNALEEDGPDVVVRYGPQPTDDIYARKLFDEFLMPLASPKLLNSEDIRRPEDMLHLRLLSEGSTAYLEGRSEWDVWFDAAGLSMRGNAKVMRFSGWGGDFVIQAAIEGTGIALGRAFLAYNALSEGRLVCPFGPILPTGRAYYAACRKGNERKPHIRALIDWLEKEAAIMSTMNALHTAAG